MVTGTVTGLRARKKEQTRRALRDAAVRLVQERGLDKVTVEDIAEAAEVSPRTFFNYFRTKEDAIVGVDPQEIAEVRAAVAARPAAEPPIVALGKVMIDRFADLDADRVRQWQLRMAVVRSDPRLFGANAARFAEYERALTEVIAERTGLDADTDPYPALLVAATTAVVRTAVLRWRTGASGRSLAAELTNAIDLLASGFPAPPRPRRQPAAGRADL